ncbi:MULTISPECIES: formyltransferase family protein [unclassified Brenneria]|uniref:formyltransferase family protein n=1 Tax=unclassified Brenneria TaxID=2634434 RepID=UPI001556B6D2|nr:MULTISPECIES: formyltransferase family protein [unclassified Brenneria]MBJ7223352.1 hypothetical protein [Brenneria sp. L3-3C-1]MEE3644592.1 formyltransferase family protein [Brenneria sp. L3_3C_1]MEE3652154.1 formyltransferase family protein [Brenneria sp. HEZEL_4_2_4]NPD02113.1 hypothetical protein [Brenneria sp. hezel4-2-4]
MNKKKNDGVLFIGDCSFWSETACEFVSSLFNRVTPVFWENGMKKNPMVSTWRGDWIISFKSDLVLPEPILDHAAKGAINFHPSSPKYRGLGGYHYAVDNHDARFGATCHYMDKHIDHGQIIQTSEFRLSPTETPEMLRSRTAAYCLTLLYDVCIKIYHDEPLPRSAIRWGDRLFTHRELENYLTQSRKPTMNVKTGAK